jgi:hypothetical protein
VADRHLALLHHLQQGGLDLCRGAVDLVGEQEVAEDGAELRLELTLVRPVDAGADEVGGDEVGRELDALERPAEDGGGRLDRQRLRKPRYSLDQQVALGEQADEDALEHCVLAGDHPPDLVERLLQTLSRLRGHEGGMVVGGRGHIGLLGSRSWTTDRPTGNQFFLRLG